MAHVDVCIALRVACVRFPHDPVFRFLKPVGFAHNAIHIQISKCVIVINSITLVREPERY